MTYARQAAERTATDNRYGKGDDMTGIYEAEGVAVLVRVVDCHDYRFLKTRKLIWFVRPDHPGTASRICAFQIPAWSKSLALALVNWTIPSVPSVRTGTSLSNVLLSGLAKTIFSSVALDKSTGDNPSRTVIRSFVPMSNW